MSVLHLTTATWNGANTNKAQMNIGQGEIVSQNFINILKPAQLSSLGTNSPTVFDDYGYPVSALSSAISYTISALSTAGPWVLSWPSTRTAWKANFLSSNATVSSSTGSPTITNGSGSGDMTVAPSPGVAGSVTFSFGSASGKTFRWDSTGTYAAGSGEISLVRSSDLTAHQAGEYWTPECKALVAGLGARALRPMGMTVQNPSGGWTNEVKFDYRTELPMFSWATNKYPAEVWSSSITTPGSGAGQMAQYTAAAATVTPLTGWVANEIIMGTIPQTATNITISGAVSNGGNVQLTVSSSAPLTAGQAVWPNFIAGTVEANVKTTILSVDDATHITINIPFVHAYTSGGGLAYQSLAVTGKSGGSKLILERAAFPIGSSFSITSGVNGLFFYDAILDAVIYDNRGITGSPPIEALVQLTNGASSNLWYCVPAWAEDDYVTSSAALIVGLLDPGLLCYYEYNNENWNPGFSACNWEALRGFALGISPASPSQTAFNYEGLRIRQIFGLIPDYTNLRRLYMVQGGQATSVYAGSMAGSTLGSFGYSTSPDRPIDVVDVVGYAPYFAGLGITGKSTDAGSIAPTIYDAPALQSIIDNYAGSPASSIATIDDLIRQGRNRVQNVTAVTTTFTTPLVHNFTVGDRIRFGVSGGTAYSGINTQLQYQVLTTPTTSTFTAAPRTNGVSTGVAVNAGSAGTGTMTAGYSGSSNSSSIFNVVNGYYTRWQDFFSTAFSPAPARGQLQVEWYEGSPEPSANTPAQLAAISITSPNSATITGTTNGTSTITGLSSTVGLSVGMTVVGTGVPANAVIGTLDTGASSLTLVSAVTGASLNATAGSPTLTIDDAYLTLQNALLAWKNDASAALTTQAYYKAFMGTDSGFLTYNSMTHANAASTATSQLVLLGGGLYGFVNGLTPVSPVFQMYNGFHDFSVG